MKLLQKLIDRGRKVETKPEPKEERRPEALRIQELEAGHAGEQSQSGGFLDSMRDAIFGQNQSRGSGSGSVPNVRAPDMGGGGRPVWNSGQALQQGQAPGQYGQAQYGQQPGYGQPYGGPQPAFGGGGGSFLGTAAAAAAGVVGGSLLAGSIRSLMGGGGHQQAFADSSGLGGSGNQKPWSDQSGGNLARDAGINDIGSSNQRADNNDSGSQQGFFDSASNDDNDQDHDSDDFDGDDGDSDYA